MLRDRIIPCFCLRQGGKKATTLGAMIHELGHTLDLGHTENGIMARGFDDMDRFFTICPTAKSDSVGGSIGHRRNSLRFCGAVPKETHSIEKSSRFGKIKRNDNGSNILEEYQKRKYYRKMDRKKNVTFHHSSCI